MPRSDSEPEGAWGECEEREPSDMVVVGVCPGPGERRKVVYRSLFCIYRFGRLMELNEVRRTICERINM